MASAPDILSRRKDHEEGVQDNNKDQVLLKLEYFEKGGERIAVGIEGEETEWLEKVKKEQDADTLPVSLCSFFLHFYPIAVH